jgi:hypothetical protein
LKVIEGTKAAHEAELNGVEVIDAERRLASWELTARGGEDSGKVGYRGRGISPVAIKLTHLSTKSTAAGEDYLLACSFPLSLGSLIIRRGCEAMERIEASMLVPHSISLGDRSDALLGAVGVGDP